MQLRAGAIAGALLVGAALAAALYRNQLKPIAGSSPLAACQLAATDAAHPGMVFIPAGNFMMGANYAYPEEGPQSRRYCRRFLDRPNRSHQRAICRVRGSYWLPHVGRTRHWQPCATAGSTGCRLCRICAALYRRPARSVPLVVAIPACGQLATTRRPRQQHRRT